MTNDFKARLDEFGVPVDALQGMIGEEMDRRFNELAAGLSALDKAQNDPWMKQHGAAFGQWLEGNPEVSRRMQNIAKTDAETALEYGATIYRAASGEQRQRQKPDYQAGTVMLPGGLPPERQAPINPSVNNQDGQAEVAQAWARYQEQPTRDRAKAYAHARLHTVITDEHLKA